MSHSDMKWLQISACRCDSCPFQDKCNQQTADWGVCGNDEMLNKTRNKKLVCCRKREPQVLPLFASEWRMTSVQMFTTSSFLRQNILFLRRVMTCILRGTLAHLRRRLKLHFWSRQFLSFNRVLRPPIHMDATKKHQKKQGEQPERSMI